MSSTKPADETVVPAQRFDPRSLAPASSTALRIGFPVGLPSELVLPVLVARGREQGPTLLVSAGVHGDEFEGIAAVHDFVRSLDPIALSGTVVALPVCNPLALGAGSRETPPSVDGKNLAREFPGREDGTATQELAAGLFALVRRLLGREDLFVDLHSGGARYRYAPMAGYRSIEGAARGASEEAARHFAVGRLWEMEDESGTFNAETSRLGIPTVGAEAPGQGACRPEDVAAYVDGLRNLLRFRGMVPGGRPARDEGPPWQPTQIHATEDGLWQTLVSPADEVKEGDVLGRVLSPFGDELERPTSPLAGEVWAVRTFGSIRAGDMAAWVAKPVDGQRSGDRFA